MENQHGRAVHSQKYSWWQNSSDSQRQTLSEMVPDGLGKVD